MRFLKTRLLNRLWVRLTLSFIIITEASLLLVAFLAESGIRSEFGRYIVRRDVVDDLGRLPQALTAFYGKNATWNGVESVFFSMVGPPTPKGRDLFSVPDSLVIRGANQIMFQADVTINTSDLKMFETMLPPRLMIADASMKVVFPASGDRVGSPLNSEERVYAVPISGPNTDVTVGYIAPNMLVPKFKGPEQDFLEKLRQALLTAALVVGGMGVGLGLVLSRTLVSPLAGLARAARAFAAHEWNRRVPAKGTSEVAEVAHAFNEMADELRKAEMLRREMIADIAHELRTPLTVMQGNLRAMLDGVYALDRTEIATIYDETRRLSHLVNDLRELALADAGKLPLNTGPTDVADILNSTVSSFAIAAESQEVDLQLDVPADLPLAQADSLRIDQVVRNLTVNALQHTEEGEIRLAAEKQDSYIRVSVADTGPGIPAEDLPRVFDRFYRGDRARTRTSGGSGGTGLGLAIAKAWIEAMGGQIGVESAQGKGSKFWFTLPIISGAPARLNPGTGD
jgi:two-component system OmpR family sensor kinase